jgi:exonuclease VII small subunit
MAMDKSSSVFEERLTSANEEVERLTKENEQLNSYLKQYEMQVQGLEIEL